MRLVADADVLLSAVLGGHPLRAGAFSRRTGTPIIVGKRKLALEASAAAVLKHASTTLSLASPAVVYADGRLRGFQQSVHNQDGDHAAEWDG